MPAVIPQSAIDQMVLSRTTGRSGEVVAAAGLTPGFGTVDDLTRVDVDWYSSKPNQVVHGVRFGAKVVVRPEHPGVVFDNCFFTWDRPTRTGRLISLPTQDVTLQHFVVDGRGLIDEAIFGGGHVSYLYGDVSGVADGLKPGSGGYEYATYVHHLVRPAAVKGQGIHADCWQAIKGYGFTLDRVVHESFNEITGDFCNSGLQASADRGPLTGIKVVNSLMSGGNFTISANGGLAVEKGGGGYGTVGIEVANTQVIRDLYRSGPVNAGRADVQSYDVTFWQPPTPAPEAAPIVWAKP